MQALLLVLLTSQCGVDARRVDAVTGILHAGENLNAAEQFGLQEVKVAQARALTGHDFDYFMVRRCLSNRVARWELEGLPADVLATPPAAVPQEDLDTLARLVEKRFDLIDALENHKRNNGFFQNLVKKYRSSTRKALDKELSSVEKRLKTMKFDYDAMESRCKKGFTEETYGCMLENATTHLKTENRLPIFVRAAIDLEDHLAYKGRYSKGMTAELKKALGNVKKTIKAYQYSLEKTQKMCKKKAEVDLKALRAAVAADLSGGYKTSWWGGDCLESTEKTCPEGTAPQIRRRFDAVKGATAAFTAFWTAQAVKIGLGALIGTILGAGAGPAGAAAGAATGVAIGAAMPGPTPLSAAAFFWASTGPLECACFPRDCYLDEARNTCAVGAMEGAPSRNPYGRAMPFAATKCVRKSKSKKDTTEQCEMQACIALDYAPELQLPGGKLFGKVGNVGGELFNCLSNDGTPAGSVSVDMKLWNGLDNTAEGRITLFRALNPPLPELGDDVEDVRNAP